jgi:hypothetical protein
MIFSLPLKLFLSLFSDPLLPDLLGQFPFPGAFRASCWDWSSRTVPWRLDIGKAQDGGQKDNRQEVNGNLFPDLFLSAESPDWKED